MKVWAHNRPGFTIVELLIVIVVIAILAAITIVAYNGIQQQASNAAINDAASKSLRLIQAYIAKTGQYPYTVENDFVCITTETDCRRNSAPMGANSTFNAAMATVGSLPRVAPMATDTRGGVTYSYHSARVVNGTSQPAILSYYIKGPSTRCGLPALNTEGTTSSTSSSGYTTGDIGGSGATQCVVSIPGPGAP